MFEDVIIMIVFVRELITGRRALGLDVHARLDGFFQPAEKSVFKQ